jgi:acylphosphatase
MVKKRIIVKGNVQGVGYRVLVKRYAQNMGIKGVVRNLKDGSVEIFCESPETVLERFLKGIDIKRRDENMLSVNVENIEVFDEGSKGYKAGRPPKFTDLLDIDYGMKISFAEKESLERQELIVLGGSQIHQDLDVIRTDLNTLDVKYGVISSSIASIDRNFAELVKLIKEQKKE